MIYGFTGSEHGMSQKQYDAVGHLFSQLYLSILHHGDCVGADAQAHVLAGNLEAWRVIHPPSETKARAYCQGRRCIVLEPYTYLLRNRHIAKCALKGLIAAPREDQEIWRSGTWATIRYARAEGRQIWRVHRDGSIIKE